MQNENAFIIYNSYIIFLSIYGSTVQMTVLACFSLLYM